MFLPVKPDFPLLRFPVMTLLVCLICIAVFLKQERDWNALADATVAYCEVPRDRLAEMVIRQIADLHEAPGCGVIMYMIANHGDDSEMIDEIVGELRPLAGLQAADSKAYVSQLLHEELRRYRQMVPPDPDIGLAYESESWNPWLMITSSFAHGDWWHIIFNLMFFIAFGMAVEMLISPLAYAGLIIAISFITGIFTSVSAMASGIAVSSLGLSGVVMAMIGLSAYLLPRGKIRCFYWFVVWFGTVAVPIWAMSLWFIGGDIYALFADDDHGVINVMAHVTGGLGGYLFGVVFLQKAKEDAIGLQMEIDRTRFRPRFH